MPLAALLDEMSFERREPVFPIPSILIDETRYAPHGLRGERDAMLAPDNGPSNEPCSLQHTHMLGHRIERHIEGLRELRHGRFPSLQPCEQCSPRRIAQRGEHAAQTFICIINHMVEY